MNAAAVATTPEVDRQGVTFRLAAGEADVSAVRLLQEVVHDVPPPEFVRAEGGLWSLRFARPPVDRFEYRFEVERSDGSRDLWCDPANPLRAGGAFGERSVVEFPGYAAPAWARSSPPRGERRPVDVPSPSLGTAQPVLLWAAPGTEAEEPLPLLLALDGHELDEFSGITQMLDTLTWWGHLPPMRAALLHPVQRTDDYSASPAFATALRSELLPVLEALAPSTVRVGLGVSLGALALLHAHRSPDLRRDEAEGATSPFGALFLQSGSFFRPGRLVGFEHVERVERFVGETREAGVGARTPIVMTCGTVEENFADNVSLAAALRAHGADARLHGVRDAHNWVAWRDAWTPHLVALVQKVAA